MSAAQIIIHGALAVLGIVCLWLAVWCKYNDGIVGKLALGAAGIACVAAVIHAAQGVPHLAFADPVVQLLVVAFAVFMARHLWRRRWRFRAELPPRRFFDRGLE